MLICYIYIYVYVHIILAGNICRFVITGVKGHNVPLA